jgi:DHA3 family macrolide efflux protein-like MFS transporter
MLQGGLGILTAPLGAMLLAVVGMTGVMAVDVITALFAILPLLFVKVPEPERRGEPEGAGRATFMHDVMAGLRYLRGLPGHMALMGCAALMNLFLVPAFALLPLLVLQELGGDVGTQAWLTSALGVGIVAGGLALGVGGGSGNRARTALVSLLGMGAATLALGLTPASLPTMAIVAMCAVGLSSAVANGCIVAILQATIAPEFQGRVFTLMMSLATAMTPIGLLLATPVADLAGVRAWYVAAGIVCAAMAVVLARPIVRIEESAAAAEPSPASPLL